MNKVLSRSLSSQPADVVSHIPGSHYFPTSRRLPT